MSYSLGKHLTGCSCSFPPMNMGESNAICSARPVIKANEQE